MIKNLFLIFISVFFACQVKANEDLVTIRVVLEKSVTSSRVANEFYKTINKIESSLPIMIGFRAMSELVLCKHVFNPLSKLSHFYSGRDLLEKAISIEPNNVELRFYRYCTQLNVPGMLNYSDDLTIDKGFLLDFIKTQAENPKKDIDLYVRIKKFMLNNKHATQEDKLILKGI